LQKLKEQEERLNREFETRLKSREAELNSEYEAKLDQVI
jgi:hypothetical protein